MKNNTDKEIKYFIFLNNDKGETLTTVIYSDGSVVSYNSTELFDKDTEGKTPEQINDLFDKRYFATTAKTYDAKLSELVSIVMAENASKPKKPVPEKSEGKSASSKNGHKKHKAGFFAGVAAALVLVGTALGLSSCDKKNKNEKSRATASYSDDDVAGPRLLSGDNSAYDNYTLAQLYSVTNNGTQLNAMKNIESILTGFNNNFAKSYIEEGVTTDDGYAIRPALKVEEVVALQQGYNRYSKEEIKAIFNGADVRENELTEAFKTASLQLMSAYVLEDPEKPFSVVDLINSAEGKVLYEKYHGMFLSIKRARTIEEKTELTAEFYAEIRKDFTVDNSESEVGISHDHKDRESYKAALLPMLAATEMLYKDLPVDHTLNDFEVDTINGAGVCDYAFENFEYAQNVLAGTSMDKSNPTYQQYYNQFRALDSELYDSLDRDVTVREVTLLDRFYRNINWHFIEVTGGYDIVAGGTYSRNYSIREDGTYVEFRRREGEIPADKKAEIDAQFEAENEAAREAGYAEAEARRQELQREADAQRAALQQEVDSENRDTEDIIRRANETIQNGGTVNQNDLGSNVKIDPRYLDENGNYLGAGNLTTDQNAGSTSYSDAVDAYVDYNMFQQSESTEEQEYETSSDVQYIRTRIQP